MSERRPLGVATTCLALALTVGACGSPGIGSDLGSDLDPKPQEDVGDGAAAPLGESPDSGLPTENRPDSGSDPDAGPAGLPSDAGVSGNDGGVTVAVDSGASPSRGETARTLVDAGARLVDVRSTTEYATSHLPGAINVPVDVLPSRLAELEPRAQPIVVYCASGNRSSRAKAALLDAGFESVFDLGAMSNWSR